MSHSLLLMIEAKCWKTEPIRHQNCYDDSNDVKNGDFIASSCLTTRRKFKIQEKNQNAPKPTPHVGKP